MPLETRIFDPATYLDSDEARAAYLTEALETDDPAFIADALGVIARARDRDRIARGAGLSGEGLDETVGSPGNVRLGEFLRVIHALGLRLTVKPAAS